MVSTLKKIAFFALYYAFSLLVSTSNDVRAQTGGSQIDGSQGSQRFTIPVELVETKGQTEDRLRLERENRARVGDELKLQQELNAISDEAAQYSKVSTIASIMGSAFLVVTLYLTGRATRHAAKAARAADLTANLLRAEQRAWVTLDLLPEHDLRVAENGTMVTRFGIRLTNIGREPATNLNTHVRLYANGGGGGYEERASDMLALLERLNDRAPARNLLPTESLTITPDVVGPADEIIGDRFIVRVIVAARYETQSVDGGREIVRSFDITRTNDGVAGRVIFRNGGNVPARELEVRKNGFGHSS